MQPPSPVYSSFSCFYDLSLPLGDNLPFYIRSRKSGLPNFLFVIFCSQKEPWQKKRAPDNRPAVVERLMPVLESRITRRCAPLARPRGLEATPPPVKTARPAHALRAFCEALFSMAFQLIFNSRCVAYAFDMFARFSRRTGKVIERQVIKLVLLVLPPFRVVRAAPPSLECERAQGAISGLCRDVNLESGCHAAYYTQSPRRLQGEFF